MPKSPPALQFYPSDFMTGTSRLTTIEVGGYILLLCEQWNTGSIPGDDEKALASIMRCSRAVARTIWEHLSSKFRREEPGLWKNPRMETERQKQAEFRARQTTRSKLGNEKRWHPTGDSPAMPEASPSPAMPAPSPEPRSSSSSLKRTRTSTKEASPTTNSTPSGAPTEALVVGPVKFMKKGEKFAFYGSRLKVPHVFHDELVGKLAGENPQEKLTSFYETVNADAEMNHTPILDVFEFLRPKFVEWAKDAVADAAVAKFLRGT